MDNRSNNQGIGLFGVMFIVFLVLKLCGVITWSWWAVTAPLWAPITVVLLIALIVIFISAICSDSRK